ncbi:MAG: hypothetical protein OXL37_03590 [Chloroflexota bacterium]|nr:hypothetical protein [Chloroflexota bacterium]MDE2958600.1 hypothetical protein [Chloroflexota bacterium]
MSKQNIKWPFGLTGQPEHPHNRWADDPISYETNEEMATAYLLRFSRMIQNAPNDDRREFFTWFRQMVDEYGYDSLTAIERKIERE